MCGIAGIVALRLDRESLSALGRAARALEHRGPDSHGFLLYPGPGGRAEAAADPAALTLEETSGPAVGLASRRLAIIDLSPGGQQPMSTMDGRFHLVYNGELYNYLDLRRELESAGVRFRSTSDTEVLLAACAHWGVAALERLVGMFALALLDTQQRTLLLARDGFGIKPLYYARTANALVFASEIRALLEFPGISRRADPSRVYDYLISSNTDHGQGSMLAAVRQVPPAHRLELPLDLSAELTPVRFWSPDGGERSTLSYADAAAQLRGRFLESVGLHLQSDVPLGFALSGGLDSSAVLAAARQLQGPAAELHAFSYVADDPAISEAPFQELATLSARAIPHKLLLQPQELAADFDALTDAQGEPFASPTIYAQRRIFSLARDAGLKVVLGGQGADELFAGYARYLAPRLVSLVRAGDFTGAWQFLSVISKRTATGRKALARQTLALTAWPPLRRLVRRLRGRAPEFDWVNQQWFQERGHAAARAWRPRGSEAMKELLVHTLEEAHLQALLRYEDRNAMTFSIENRVPFLTPSLARFALSLPEEYLVSPQGIQKAVLRTALRGLVPDPILDRRDKIGFAIPVAAWLLALTPWVEAKLARARALPVLRADMVTRRWDAVRLARSIPDAFLIWRWIGLVTWAERMGVEW